MNKKSKLILASAVFIAALMLLVPLAQTDLGGGYSNDADDSIILSDGGNVSTLDELTKAVETGGNITLNDDITITGLSGPLVLKDKTILDLNGYTITINNIDDGISDSPKNNNRIAITSGEVTITDSKKTGKIVYEYDHAKWDFSPIKVGGGNEIATLTLTDVNIKCAHDYGVGVFTNGNLIVNGGSITSGLSAISGNGVESSCEITLNGGTYKSTNSAAVFFPSTAKLTVNGGSFEGLTGFDVRAGTFSIKDAKITATGNTASNFPVANGPSGWGMGIAIFDHKSYDKTYSDISVTIGSDVKFFNGTDSSHCSVYDIFIGQHPGNEGTGTEVSFTFPEPFKATHNITLLITDGNTEASAEYLKYTISKESDKYNAALALNLDANQLFTLQEDLTLQSGNSLSIGKDASFNFNSKKCELATGATFTNNGIIGVSDANGLVNAVAIGGEIKLLDSITINDTMLEIKKDLTLDLNSKTITTAYNKCLFKVFSTATLTIIDPNSTTKGTITNSGDSESTPVIQVGEVTGTGGKAIIKDGIKINSDNGYGILVITKATLIIDNAEITAKSSAISGNGLYKDTIITINDGIFKSSDSAAVFFPSTAELTVNGGSFEGLTGFDIRAGTISIKNATIKATGNIESNSKFSAANGPSGWGMGIAIFDHSSYAKGEITGGTQSYLDIKVSIDNVTFKDCTTCNIFVGKHPGEGKSEDVAFSNVVDHKPIHKINIDINKVNFTKKGLYIYGANDVTITGCTFENIDTAIFNDENVSNSEVNAIHLNWCTGNITIGGNDETDGNVVDTVLKKNAGKAANGRAIFVQYNGQNSASEIVIKNNTISNVAYNAIQVYTYAANVTVKNNTITNWDSDDSESVGVTDDGYIGGRAVRITLVNTTTAPTPTITVSDNTFIKDYDATINSFIPNLGENASATGYDDGNILKITIFKGATLGTLNSSNNILVLTGIKEYYGEVNPLFLIDDKNTESKLTTPSMVIFNPNGGYFNTSSDSGVLCSLISSDGTLAEPTVPTRSNHSFVAWYSDKELTTEWNVETGVTADTTLYAKWTYNGGSGTPITPPTPPVVPEEPIVPDDKGNAEIKVDEKKAEELVHEAVTSGSNSVTLVDKENIEGTVTSVTIPVSDLETISKQIESNQNIDSVSIATSAGEVIIEKEVLNDIIENANAETIVVEVVDAKDQLNEEQKKTVGDNPVYDVNIRAGSEYIKSFNGKTITVSIPYELQPGEDPNNLVVYYLKDDGTVEKMKGTYKDGQVSFETDHLSKFVIAYEVQEPVTPDNPDQPAKEDNDNTIYYIVAAIVVILIIAALAYYFLKKKQ
ncbi:InlB B-repeat-containing protein [Candidatus Methanomassiliicoccus intestinalis]|uniref:InlB B-repeat-containing protein n=1 Tax=Candidatus Methanomassiliicoccus intestinalis TaxID=1406512 RepID=UPI0037DD2AEC